jgi:broad specificity phosphatase PhoE
VENPVSVVIPKGEDLRDFETRVISAFNNIVSLNQDKTVAVFSHGGVISIFINSILKTTDFWNKIPDSTSLTVVEYVDGQAKITAFNDTAHLWVK